MSKLARRQRVACLVAVALVALVGCSDSSNERSSSTAPTVAPVAGDLIGRWRLVDTSPSNSQGVGNLGAFVEFDHDFTVRGRATCNTFFAQWSLDATAGHVRFTNFMLGGVACENGASDIFWNLTSGRVVGAKLILAMETTATAKATMGDAVEFVFER